MSAPSISQSWLTALRVYTKPQALRMFFLGFSSGLPLLLVLGTLSFWLREAGIELSTIGMVTWVGLAYGFKWAWAPLVDRVRLPLLGPVYVDGQGFLPEDRYSYGLSKDASGRLKFISSGLGGFRAFNRPEVSIITLRYVDNVEVD